MAIRVHELAKQLHVPSKDIISILRELKVAVRGHMSSIEDDAAVHVRVELIKRASTAAPVKKKPAVKKAAAKKAPAKKAAAKKAAAKKPAAKKAAAVKKKPAEETVDVPIILAIEKVPAEVVEEPKEAAVEEAPEAVEEPAAPIEDVPPAPAEVPAAEAAAAAEAVEPAPAAAEPTPAAAGVVEAVPAEPPAAPAEKKAPPVAEKPGKHKPAKPERTIIRKPAPRRFHRPFRAGPARSRPRGARSGGRGRAAVKAPPEPPKRPVIGEGATVGEIAQQLGMKPSLLIKKLIDINIFASLNQRLDGDAIRNLVKELDREADVDIVPAFGEQEAVSVSEADESKLVPRPPIVVVMGHIDHGKTSLLDAIRETNVVSQERGGITQHIGASEVELRKGRVVFLDTPGHEAFTAMRARGAKVTDVAVLVVAADDGIMPQTVEAIDHCRAAGVAMVVAINKMDRPDANPDRVKRQLAEHDLLPEDMGGKTICIPISALKKTGIDRLLEMLLLEAEMLELRANPDHPAVGTVIEGKLDRGRGPVGTVLVQSGTLHTGDAFITGMFNGKVRAMISCRGDSVEEAGPSTAVEVLGFSGVPQAGDTFQVVSGEQIAREIIFRREEVRAGDRGKPRSLVSLEDLHSRIEHGEIRELKIVLKGDVHGSMEALGEALEQIGTDEVKLMTIHEAVGQVSESDVMLASASDAIIIAYHTGVEPKAHMLAKREGVDIRRYAIIYEAINDVRAAMEGLLEPEVRDTVIGKAEVRQMFQVSKTGTVAGSMVLEGRIRRGAHARLRRDDEEIYEGRIATLKRFKDDAREVEQGFECGITLANFADVKEGDVVECFEREEIARKL